MRRYSRQSDLEVLVNFSAKLPWKLCLVLALVAYLGFHQLAEMQAVAAHGIQGLSASVRSTFIKTISQYLQYLTPLFFLVAALLSVVKKHQRARLLTEAEKRSTTAPLQALSWRAFEELTAAHFERIGYSVSLTPDGADGGVDIVATKGREVFLIQCKRWRSTQVGVGVVRELFGVMAARGATGAFVVSIGSFTKDAEDFAQGRNIELIDANTFLTAASIPMPTIPGVAEDGLVPVPFKAPSCPRCGAQMIRRVAKQGANKGQAFYGCSAYPVCRGTTSA